jgi:predicted ATPase with chaperone activity
MSLMSTAVHWLIAGGPVARPGAVSRPRHGMCLLDAPPECRRQVLAVLMQLLEESLLYI